MSPISIFKTEPPYIKHRTQPILGKQFELRRKYAREVSQRIQDTTRTWLRLDILWKDPDSNPKWKLLIYDAVIRSKQCSASPIFRTLLDTFPAECPSYMVKTQTVCIRFLFSDFWTLFGVPVRKQNAAALIFILSVSAWVGVHAQKQLFGVGLGRC